MSHSHSHGHGPTADVSVRPGLPEDARAWAAIQVAAWRSSYERLWPEHALASLDVAAIEESWRSALSDPPTAKHRLFTACAGPAVVGFAALAPVPDEEGTGEIVALEVSPARRSDGHGSRLLAACADVLRQTNASAMRTWVVTGDDGRAKFLDSAGLAPTGLVRTIDVLGTEVTEEAWRATLA
ncbi:GNAT family N-acetyltransferase [Pseudactinotalea terrae]|uniref:GNAT family N-acetyltransferase n=1 Tax=Pseudactinotalea terrae TaxID=1743262 RepID=UPI0012E11B6A|nr:GNAT family N-acetyltransferase [Pseudactinotalea terrae]